jgi:hypothetical protein
MASARARSVSEACCAACASSLCCRSAVRAVSVSRCAFRAATVCHVLIESPITSASPTAVAALKIILFLRNAFCTR